MSEVRVGTVNGLPCVQVVSYVEETFVHEYEGYEYTQTFVDERTPWMCGFPPYWPHDPENYCLDCDTVLDPRYEGHFCTPEASEDEVPVYAPDVQILTAEQRQEAFE